MPRPPRQPKEKLAFDSLSELRNYVFSEDTEWNTSWNKTGGGVRLNGGKNGIMSEMWKCKCEACNAIYWIGSQPDSTGKWPLWKMETHCDVAHKHNPPKLAYKTTEDGRRCRGPGLDPFAPPPVPSEVAESAPQPVVSENNVYQYVRMSQKRSMSRKRQPKRLQRSAPPLIQQPEAMQLPQAPAVPVPLPPGCEVNSEESDIDPQNLPLLPASKDSEGGVPDRVVFPMDEPDDRPLNVPPFVPVAKST
ncbi:hypothetical protein J8273_1400 [Carpediemonas membranifera]|uniref:Uncharacterized protein n=1 Tax=Carpediemonas membranifera TaxID=201153 RepID=A0A8J6E4C8_9EUKA|nr:hypothetical protein J8273_1400 [Carpediemonas membranifera]|eukprot:KAG9397043.1 hypothetical protein J8273_1400 [Carpediemonas membranifera]